MRKYDHLQGENIIIQSSILFVQSSSPTSSLSSICCLANGLLALNLVPNLSRMNGIGTSKIAKHPRIVLAQPFPCRSRQNAVSVKTRTSRKIRALWHILSGRELLASFSYIWVPNNGNPAPARFRTNPTPANALAENTI